MNSTSICYLNSNDGSGIISFGRKASILDSSPLALEKLQLFLDLNKGNYIFGSLSYDLKNEIEQLKSKENDALKFPLVNFWVPEYVIKKVNGNYHYLQGDKTKDAENLLNTFFKTKNQAKDDKEKIDFLARTSKENYLKNIEKIKSLLQQGEIYELNYCQEYFSKDVHIKNPLETYFKINELTKAPFSVFLRADKHYVFCGSPERFIQKKERNSFLNL